MLQCQIRTNRQDGISWFLHTCAQAEGEARRARVESNLTSNQLPSVLILSLILQSKRSWSSRVEGKPVQVLPVLFSFGEVTASMLRSVPAAAPRQCSMDGYTATTLWDVMWCPEHLRRDTPLGGGMCRFLNHYYANGKKKSSLFSFFFFQWGNECKFPPFQLFTWFFCYYYYREAVTALNLQHIYCVQIWLCANLFTRITFFLWDPGNPKNQLVLLRVAPLNVKHGL